MSTTLQIVRVRATLGDKGPAEDFNVRGELIIAKEFCRVTIDAEGWIYGLPENAHLTFFDWSEPMQREHATLDEITVPKDGSSIYVPVKMGVAVRIRKSKAKDAKVFVFTVCNQQVVLD